MHFSYNAAIWFAIMWGTCWQIWVLLCWSNPPFRPGLGTPFSAGRPSWSNECEAWTTVQLVPFLWCSHTFVECRGQPGTLVPGLGGLSCLGVGVGRPSRGLSDCLAKNVPCLPVDWRLNEWNSHGWNTHVCSYALQAFNSKTWTCVAA